MTRPNKGIAYDKGKDARGSWQNASDGGKEAFLHGDIYLQLLKTVCGRSTADGTNNGIVTWADIPTNITFMPYIYTSVDAGVKELIKTNFENKVAIYQRSGTTIMRSQP